jgi:DNA-binding FadR family transcriptional regulator
LSKEEEKLGALLESGALDPEALRKLEQSADGQRVKALLGDEKRLTEAIRRGDAAALRNAMETLLRTPEGRRLFRTLGGMMNGR